MNKATSAFTIDLEDGISIAMKSEFGIDSPMTSRVLRLADEILNLADKHESKFTFFVVGKLAKEFPELIKKIHAAGHEIGVHGYTHIIYDKLSYDEIYDELNTTKKILEDLTGEEVIGHRAPRFSIKEDKKWIMDILCDLNFMYDSSFLPNLKGKHWHTSFKKDMYIFTNEQNKSLVEIPISTISIMGKEVPFSGGSYLRLFPFPFVNYAFDHIQMERPVVLYIHPYELDTERYPDYYLEAMKKVSTLKRMKLRSNWVNRSKTLGKLDYLLSNHKFTTMKELIINSNNLNLKN